MNGLIASVMALMMTGMVFGQAPQPNGQGFGESISDLPGRFLLPMGDAEIQLLKQHGVLSATIIESERPYIDLVVVVGDERDAEQNGFAPVSVFPTASSVADKTLEFQLTDSTIEVMRRQGLQYKMSASERGEINEVVVTYDRFLTQNNLGSEPFRRNNAQFANVQPRQNDGYLESRLPGQREYGPRLTDNFELARRQNQIATNRNSQTFTPRIDSTTNRRNSNIQDEYENRRLDDQRLADQRLADRQRANDNSFACQRRTQLTGTQGFVPDRNQLDNAQDNWGRQRSTDYESTTRPRGYSNSELSPRIVQDQHVFDTGSRRNAMTRESDSLQLRNSDDRMRSSTQDLLAAENDALKRELLDAKYERERNDRKLADAESFARRLAAKDRRREDELEDLKNRRDSRRDASYSTARNPSRLSGDNDEVIVGHPRNTESYTGVSNRNAATPRPTNKLPTFSIEGPDVESKSTVVVGDAEILYRRMQVLWFIMFASGWFEFLPSLDRSRFLCPLRRAC